MAVQFAYKKHFLFNRCGSKQGEEDYRPLFENFIQDLLSTVNKPEWPAAELLLSLLGRLLVRDSWFYLYECISYYNGDLFISAETTVGMLSDC